MSLAISRDLKPSNLYGSGGSGGEVVAGNVDVCDVDVWVE